MKSIIIFFICTISFCVGSLAQGRVTQTMMNMHEVLTDDFTGAMLGGMGTIMTSGGSIADMREGTATLSSNECVPDFSQDLSTSYINLGCFGNMTCEMCFNTAFSKINFYRRQLGRLRCIYNNTKSYKDAAVALGDNTSGIHAMAGIAWQKERANIMNTYKNLQKTYDTKSAEFLEGLGDSLQELNTCMALSGENNWYAKSGFIYFEFMQERYKRTD